MGSATPKKRLLRVTLIWCAVLAAGIGYGLFCVKTGMGIPCVLHEVTGLDCPGCGISRAILALARLDFAAAFGYNLLWPLYAAYFLWGGVAMSSSYVRRGVTYALPGKTWMHAVILSVVVVYGVVRNFV